MWTNLGKLTSPAVDADRTALIDCQDVDQPRVYSHGQMDRLADACARGLERQGLRRGDAVALMGSNRAEFVAAYFAIMRAGMVAVPLNHKQPPETVRFMLRDCNARLVFADGDRMPLLPPGLPAVRMDDARWEAFLDPGPYEAIRPAADECAMILYTSGSTGRPKGVQLSHAGQIWALDVRTKALTADDRLIVAAPLFHMNGLGNCKLAFAAGASLVLMPQFEARRFIAAVGRHAVTTITSVPTMMALVVRDAEALAAIDASRVRSVRMGSAPATPQLHEAVRRAFPNAAVAGGYGTTEAGPVVFGPTADRALPADGGLGWPMPGVEVRLIGADGRDADAGELWMRTPANMLGYLNLPDKTREVMTADNWYRSRDVFRRDAHGCFYFVGRTDDMFVCGGENVYPSEVEQVIERLPAVMQACVVPVTDEIKGQKPVAFVVLRPGCDSSEEAIKTFVLENAPAYQHPRRVFFTDALPLAPTNKVDRRRLVSMAERRIGGAD